MASVTPSRRSTPPRYAVACGGSSTAFTNTRRSSATRATSRFTSGVAAVTTSHAPSRIRRLERAPHAGDRSRLDCGGHLGRNHGDVSARGKQALDLRGGHRAGPDDEHAAAGELQEHGKEGGLHHDTALSADRVSNPRSSSTCTMRATLSSTRSRSLCTTTSGDVGGSYGSETPVKCSISPASALR